MSKTVAINGQIGSFHEQALEQYFGNHAKPVYCANFKQVFNSVVTEKSDLGLVAIENCLYGSINQVDALLLETGCQIIGECYLRVSFCVIGTTEAKLSEITDVYSQDIALSQCHIWLDKNLPSTKQHDNGDTAGSVDFIKQQNNPGFAAVASEHAANIHGMKVLASNIENDQKNYTRFVVITKQPQEIPDANKTSIVLTTSNDPGALYDVLGAFKQQDINLTKLDSKPIAGKPWEYMFYVDFEAGLKETRTQNLLAQLENEGHKVKILGSYTSQNAPKS